MSEKQTTKCDFYRILQQKGFLKQLFGKTETKCDITGTNIPDEHQYDHCQGNFFRCPHFQEWITRTQTKKVIQHD